MSLRARMGLAAGVAVAVAVIAVAVSAYAGTRSELQGQLDTQLSALIYPLLVKAGVATGPAPRGSSDGDEGPPPGFAGRQGFYGHGLTHNDCDQGLGLDNARGTGFGGPQGYVQLVSPTGSLCLASGETTKLPIDGAVKALARGGTGQYLTNITLRGHHLRVLVHGVAKYGAVQVALPLTQVDDALSHQMVLLVVIAAAGIALAALLGLLVARTALAPIARFTRQTERIAANPDRLETDRIDVHGGDELARLAQTFNNTLDALERSVQSQRNLVADASHELRTPIATIRANLQLMRDEDLLSDADREALRRDVIEELDELTALVGDVVELARGSKLSGEPGEIRVDQIVSAAVERTRRRAPQLTVSATAEPTLVRGDGDRIARAVANLLDNAAKYGQSGGSIEVTLTGGILTVRDHGPGFQEEDLPFVFDRFHRARDARSQPGSGLGLAIVRQAAEAHGGFVRASNAPGGGALLEIGFGPTMELDDDARLPGVASRSSPGGSSRRAAGAPARACTRRPPRAAAAAPAGPPPPAGSSTGPPARSAAPVAPRAARPGSWRCAPRPPGGSSRRQWSPRPR